MPLQICKQPVWALQLVAGRAEAALGRHLCGSAGQRLAPGVGGLLGRTSQSTHPRAQRAPASRRKRDRKRARQGVDANPASGGGA